MSTALDRLAAGVVSLAVVTFETLRTAGTYAFSGTNDEPHHNLCELGAQIILFCRDNGLEVPPEIERWRHDIISRGIDLGDGT